MAAKTTTASTPPADSVLPDARHELFAQGIAKGLTGHDAYKAAGFKSQADNTVDAAAARLRAMPSVAARIEQLMANGAAKTEITIARVLTEAGRIAFGDIRKVVSWRPEMVLVESKEEGGHPTSALMSRVTVLDSATIDEDTAAAISEVSQGASGTLRIKMHDKKGALELIGRHLGMFKDKVELTTKDGAPITPTIIISGRPEPASAPKAMGRVRKPGH